MQRSLLATMTALAAMSAAGYAHAAAPTQTRDGLYLRLGGGPSYFFDSAESEPYAIMPGFFGTAKGTIKGWSPAFELAIGHAITPGLFLGGGVYAHLVPSPTASGAEATGTVPILGTLTANVDLEFASSSLVLIGPFADYYVDPESGFHLQGSVGLGILALGEGRVAGTVMGATIPPTPEQKGYGVAAMVGAGYEWPVYGRWSVGLLGRLIAGRGSGDDASGVSWSHTIYVPGVLVSVTRN